MIKQLFIVAICLWLGFMGGLNVKPPNSSQGYIDLQVNLAVGMVKVNAINSINDYMACLNSDIPKLLEDPVKTQMICLEILTEYVENA